MLEKMNVFLAMNECMGVQVSTSIYQMIGIQKKVCLNLTEYSSIVRLEIMIEKRSQISKCEINLITDEKKTSVDDFKRWEV